MAENFSNYKLNRGEMNNNCREK